MSNTYADLATLKSPAVLNVPEDSHDERLLGLLESASRWIDGHCDRRFSALHARRTFDGTGCDTLFVPDLVSVSSLSVADARGGWQVWPASHWFPYPLDAQPTRPGGVPYTRIATSPGAALHFPMGRANVAVDGIWGYSGIVEDIGLRVAGSVDVAASDPSVTVAPAVSGSTPDVSAGQTVRIEQEQLYIISVETAAVGTNIVLTTQRGVNGTTAAGHVVGAIVLCYRYPAAVAEACLIQAAAWWQERAALPFGASRGDKEPSEAVNPTAIALLSPFRRRSTSLGV